MIKLSACHERHFPSGRQGRGLRVGVTQRQAQRRAEDRSLRTLLLQQADTHPRAWAARSGARRQRDATTRRLRDVANAALSAGARPRGTLPSRKPAPSKAPNGRDRRLAPALPRVSGRESRGRCNVPKGRARRRPPSSASQPRACGNAPPASRARGSSRGGLRSAASALCSRRRVAPRIYSEVRGSDGGGGWDFSCRRIRLALPAGGRRVAPRPGAALRRAGPGRGEGRHGAAGAAEEGMVHRGDSAGHRGRQAGARRRRERRWVRPPPPEGPGGALPPEGGCCPRGRGGRLRPPGAEAGGGGRPRGGGTWAASWRRGPFDSIPGSPRVCGALRKVERFSRIPPAVPRDESLALLWRACVCSVLPKWTWSLKTDSLLAEEPTWWFEVM